MNVGPFLAGVTPFAIVTSFTPGPNNLMLASAGARFGFSRTLRHQAGIVVGFAVMMLCVSAGVAALIAAMPTVYLAMKAVSILYILYLAWGIANSRAPDGDAAAGTPLGFFAAAGFQWINPKAWIMTLSATAAYTTPQGGLSEILLLTLVFAVVGAASTSTWVAFGRLIRRALTSQRRRSVFNWVMAALLVASVVPTLFER